MTRLPDGYSIRSGRETDFERLQIVDLAAGRLFLPTGLIDEGETGPEPIPEQALRKGLEANLLFVCCDPFGDPVGFVVCQVRTPDLYLEQISVDPAHGRRGLGAALVNHVCGIADTRRLKGVVLSTFRDLAWNGPFYRKHGFTELPRTRMKGWMKAMEKVQAETMDTSLRCFMRRPGARGAHWIHPAQKRKVAAESTPSTSNRSQGS